MAHYYLNIQNGNGLTRDDEGEDFPDLEAARQKAKEGVRSILSDELKSAGSMDLHGRIEIADASGAVVMTLPFREAIDFTEEPNDPERA